MSAQRYVTQAVGKWHMGENRESQPQHVGFDDFNGSVEEVTIPVLSLLDDKWAGYSLDFIRRMGVRSAADDRPQWSSTTAPAAPTSTTTPTLVSWGSHRPSIPTRTPSSSSTTSSAGWWGSWNPPAARRHAYRAEGARPAEAQERVAQVVALVLGWQLFEPLLAAPADLDLSTWP